MEATANIKENIKANIKITREKYTYKNIPIPGGGYVTGFLFDPNKAGRLYLRTDIGGAYMEDKESATWKSLSDHVTMDDLRETYPIALAVSRSGRLYIVSGAWRGEHAKLSFSDDGGATFGHYDLPFRAHGNMNGRGTGSKLIVDNRCENILYYASQLQGLWRSENYGETWTRLDAMAEDYLTFVAQSPDGRAIIVGSAGVTTAISEKMRGTALWISYDEGGSFSPLQEPDKKEFPGVLMSGAVPQRYSFDERYMYVTFQVMGPNAKRRDLGYSCDNGSVWGGKIYRYSIENFEGEDITPSLYEVYGESKAESGSNPMDSGGTFGRKAALIKEYKLEVLSFGLSGVDTCRLCPGLVVVSSLSKEDGDCIFRSLDYGKTWTVILHDLDKGCMDFRTEYMKPCYNGGHNLIHWLTDLKINPFDANELWFNTGTGPFCTHNLLDEVVHFSDWADGIEETVHINVYSPHEGAVQVIDIVGDLGGFAFKDLDRPCDNSFADSDGNRYITCLNADYSDIDPATVIVTARGNWTGKTKGGLIMSEDQCDTFERLEMPFGITEKIDRLLTEIEKPNVNAGWVAMSAGCNNIVWSIADGFFLPVDSVVVSNDGGSSFRKVQVRDFDNTLTSDTEVPGARDIAEVVFGDGDMKLSGFGLKVFSDRLKDDVFYGFGMNGEVYISSDGGRSFDRIKIHINDGERSCVANDIFESNCALVDTMNDIDIRGENGRSGKFIISLGKKGLWRLDFERQDNAEGYCAVMNRITAEGDIVYRVGYGIGKDSSDFLFGEKAIYMAASIGGEYGFYRTDDYGRSFVRINNDSQMFGDINSIVGDSRHYGRIYVATGSRGILYGESCGE